MSRVFNIQGQGPEADGTIQQVHDLLRDEARRAHCRYTEPTAAVIDAQSVK